MIRRLLMPPMLALVFTAACPSGVAASCAAPSPLPEQIQAAALVFVGTVQSTSNDDRIAYVRVESIWKGPLLAEHVKVFGSPLPGANTATSVDRRYQVGTRYLFVLDGADQPYQDNSCSATQPYTPALQSLAPANARKPIIVGYPTDPQLTGRQTELEIGVVVLIVLLIAAAFFAARFLRSRKRT